MHRYAPERIRNVALVGHHGSGKTTLAEALLHTAGAIPRRGRVEDGTTTCDHEPEERDRGMSLSLALAPFEWRDHKINLLDCPGEADCIGAVRAALSVADLAVARRVRRRGRSRPRPRRPGQLAAELGVPRLVFVNKLDRERADFDAVARRAARPARERLRPPRAADRPRGRPARRRRRPHRDRRPLRRRHGHPRRARARRSWPSVEHRIHDEVVEEIVAGDDELLERFLADDVPSVPELEHALTVEMEHQVEFPVLCGSAIDRRRRRPPRRLPRRDRPAADRPSRHGPGRRRHRRSRSPSIPTGDPLAVVFHTISDPYVGHLSLFRALSGTIRPDDHLTNTRTGGDERLHGLFTLAGQGARRRARGRRRRPRRRRQADRHPHRRRARPEGQARPRGAGVAPAGRRRGRPRAPDAVRRGQARPGAGQAVRGGPDAARRAVLDGPAPAARRRRRAARPSPSTGSQRRFGVGVDTEPLRVAYRETITGSAEAEGRHKKQTGGHGQFAVCVLRVEPLERGAGFQFTDKIVGGAISKGYIPAVQKGVEEAMAEGGPQGFPVVDVHVTLLDGKEHSVDSSELAFKLAARGGFRDAVAAAGAGRARAGVAWSRSTFPSELARRRARRPQLPPRPGGGNVAGGAGAPGRHRPRARRRARPLLRRAALADRRSRPVHDGARPRRGRPGEPRRPARRRGAGRRRAVTSRRPRRLAPAARRTPSPPCGPSRAGSRPLLELDEGEDPAVLSPAVEQTDRAGRDLAVLGGGGRGRPRP